MKLSGLWREFQCILSTQSEIGLFPAGEGSLYAPKTVGGWVSWVRADCIILPEPTLEWQIDISVGPELCINTPYK